MHRRCHRQPAIRRALALPFRHADLSAPRQRISKWPKQPNHPSVAGGRRQIRRRRIPKEDADLEVPGGGVGDAGEVVARQVVERGGGEPRRLRYFDSVFLLEDALAGAGVALGWRRLVDRHLESGALVAVRDGFVEVDRPHYARLTERGRHRRHARACLALFDDLSRCTDAA